MRNVSEDIMGNPSVQGYLRVRCGTYPDGVPGQGQEGEEDTERFSWRKIVDIPSGYTKHI